VTAPCLLIGLDGGTFSVLDPLMQAGVMPFLRRFVGEGVRAQLRSVNPPLTPPAWASITTGRSPGHHGVFDFFAFESPESHHVRITNSSDVRSETLWSMVGRHGRRATVLNFPLTAPPRPLAGWVVPGWVPWRFLRRACHPPGLYDRLKGLPGFNVRELALNADLEQQALNGCPPAEQADWLRVHIRRDRQWFQVLAHLMRHEPTELTAIVFDGVDRLQHLFWNVLDPRQPFTAAPPDANPVRALCLDYFRQLDTLIEQAVGLAGAQANVFVVSDHGFGPSHEIVHVNSWLARHGYLTWAPGEPVARDESDTLGIGIIGWMDKLIDWSRTRAYARTPSSNGIRICVAGRRGGEAGIAPEDYDAFRERLRRDLLDFRDERTGERVVTEVTTREETFSGPQGGDAPDLTLRLRDGGFLSTVRSDTLLTPRPEPVGTHRPEGIFAARGPAVAAGGRMAPISVMDVTPIVLHALGVPIPEDLEGRVPREIYTPEWMLTHPVRTGDPTHPPEMFPETDATGRGDEQLIVRLKALGYLE
jgi:predicted AlkP superfamily phosphohydrolase/phosphomutase